MYCRKQRVILYSKYQCISDPKPNLQVIRARVLGGNSVIEMTMNKMNNH